jgi:translocator protein
LLYVLMGISLYLAWVNHFGKEKYAPHLFAAQLFLNFLWSFLFFGLHAPLLALLDILLLWVAIAATILAFHKISSSAAYLLTPYLLWVSFAVILNASIVYLN